MAVYDCSMIEVQWGLLLIWSLGIEVKARVGGYFLVQQKKYPPISQTPTPPPKIRHIPLPLRKNSKPVQLNHIPRRQQPNLTDHPNLFDLDIVFTFLVSPEEFRQSGKRV
jgi:hypothetical protein